MVSKVAFVIDWTVIWRVPSSFFGNISSAIFLSENAFLRNIRKQAKKKKRAGSRAWKIWLRRYRQSLIRKVCCRTSKDSGLRSRWSQNSNYSNRKQWSAYKGRKIEWLALFFFFRRKQSRMLGKKESKSDGELRRKHWFCIRGNISAGPHAPSTPGPLIRHKVYSLPLLMIQSRQDTHIQKLKLHP